MSWQVLHAFDDVIDDQTGGNQKTLQSDYLPEGEFPIVDQGQELIGGYTNDAERICKADLPAIVFGDHTKSLKFIDFPFCLGADGTKILRPKVDADPKYLFYFLQTVQIPEAGYSRHFKYLRKAAIPLPPIDEQRRIAGILDQADALRRLRNRALDKLNTLGQAIFHEMFGDPKIEPNRWQTVDFDGACKDETSKSPKVQKGDYLESGDVRVIDQGQKEVAGYTTEENACQSETPVIVFGDHTRAVKYVDFAFAIGADGAKVLKPSKRFEPLFFSALLRKLPIPDLGYSRHMRAVKELQFPAPPLELQQLYSNRISTLRSQEEKLKQANLGLSGLFTSLQHRAFRGEL
ncbi:restriction endonuclease subunit S [Pseudorhodobacter sp. W20_MBD10_FR17]|uniref:restriction endonuclease subunit S n=1 Tax=Pseudorhodobacter sp. W20_MBD10_FR17 TaxID=3240266 RepID=UPI003F9C3F34